MGRLLGAKVRISRRYGVPLFGDAKALERKNYPPGIHGPKARRKTSDYGLLLAEKQKLRLQYGMMEHQFRRLFERAKRVRGVTGATLLQLLETRIDNVVYRGGFSTSRRGSRQMVVHGHVYVNGVKVTSPSYNVKAGDAIEIKNKPGSRQLAQKNLDTASLQAAPDWMTVDKEKFKAIVNRVPTREDIQVNVNEQLVVEFYSR